MTSRILTMTIVGLCSAAALAGQWTWDFDGNLSERSGAADPLTGNGTYSFEATTINGDPAQVAHVAGGNGPGSDGYFTVNNPAGPNGGGSYTNIYTLIMDIQIGEHGTYSSMYQTNTSNSNDGDWFIRDLGDGGGLGISGDYEDAGNPLRFTYGEWQRIALVVDTSNNAFRSYVDGELQNIVEGETFSQDGRWTLEDVFHIFVDNGDETAGDLWVNSFQLRDYAMSDGELAALGGATAYGIPEPATISLLALGLSALRRR